jgi:hypothetical protein
LLHGNFVLILTGAQDLSDKRLIERGGKLPNNTVFQALDVDPDDQMSETPIPRPGGKSPLKVSEFYPVLGTNPLELAVG